MLPMVSERNITTEEAQLTQELSKLRQQVARLEQQVSELHQARRQALVQAGASARIKDEFLAVLSHELRSPLNPILGWVKLLRSQQFDARMTQRALDAIERNAKLQVQLIEDLLDVSQILQGKLHLNIAQVDLTGILQAALKAVQLAAQNKQIEIKASVGSSVWVAGDAARLQQILWNLLSNAVKFTPAGGQVQVELEQISTRPDDPERRLARIWVKDSGQGIEPQFLPYMFDAFRQADSTITRQFNGLGLGLTIARHLVELHGGIIGVESAGQDQGSTFWVTLPLLSHEADIPPPLVLAPIPPVAKRESIQQVRVLLVEQNTDLQNYLALVLKSAGAKVMLAGSAGEALAKLSRWRPEVLVCGLDLPNVNGCHLLRQIRSLVPELGGETPALALVNHASESNQQEIATAGFQAYLSLPMEPEALIETVDQLVQQARADRPEWADQN
jgi:signal transduction histidine kinase/ActR/RegA family two-component response regulator